MAKLDASDFCNGAGTSGWFCDLDSFVQPKTFTKLMEGSYDNRARASPAGGKSAMSAALDELLAEKGAKRDAGEGGPIIDITAE